MIPDSEARHVQSVRKSFQILNLLHDLNGASLSELTSQLDLAKSTVHNYLATLKSMGYVVGEDGTYRLGLRFLTHGIAAKNTLGIQNVVRQSLYSLSEDLGHPTWWIAEEFGRGFFLEQSTLQHETSVYGRVGKRSYLHTHAPGKAILASLPTAEVDAIVDHHGLPEQTVKTISTREALTDELEEIRSDGFAVSTGEAVLGVQSIGTAFRSPTEGVHAIGLFGYSGDILGASKDELTTSLLSTVSELESALHGGGANDE